MGRIQFNFGEDQGLEGLIQGMIVPSETEISFYIGDNPGKNTCKAACEHCFIPFNPPEGKLAPDRKKELSKVIEIERQQIEDLRLLGYKVVPMIADTFSHDGIYLRSGLLHRNLLYDQEDFGERGVAWTSGLPLLKGNHIELLDLAWKNELDVIALTNNGTINGEVSLKGIVPPERVRVVVELIQSYNSENADHKFDISLTFTIGSYNLKKECVQRFIDYGKNLGVRYVRLNRFIDFTPDRRFHDRMLSPEQNNHFFRILQEIENKGMEGPDLLISTDFGYEGEEILGLGNSINRCGGGSHGFGVLKGIIYPCVEMLQYKIGELMLKPVEELPPDIRKNIPENKKTVYDLQFENGVLQRLAQLKADPMHKGCIGHTIQYNHLKFD